MRQLIFILIKPGLIGQRLHMGIDLGLIDKSLHILISSDRIQAEPEDPHHQASSGRYSTILIKPGLFGQRFYILFQLGIIGQSFHIRISP